MNRKPKACPSESSVLLGLRRLAKANGVRTSRRSGGKPSNATGARKTRAATQTSRAKPRRKQVIIFAASVQMALAGLWPGPAGSRKGLAKNLRSTCPRLCPAPAPPSQREKGTSPSNDDHQCTKYAEEKPAKHKQVATARRRKRSAREQAMRHLSSPGPVNRLKITIVWRPLRGAGEKKFFLFNYNNRNSKI